MKKLIFNIFVMMCLVLSAPLCFAIDWTAPAPAYFPKEKSTPKRYSSRATIQAFYDHWAESIGKDVQIKTFDAEFTGIGYKEEITNDVFPKAIIPKTADKNFITCNIYSGVLNATAYKKLMTFGIDNRHYKPSDLLLPSEKQAIKFQKNRESTSEKLKNVTFPKI